jgi:hypothetical protein
MLHPIFIVRDGRPLGWALTGRTPLKTRHLAANLYMSGAYWTPSHDTVFVDCIAAWVEADSETQDVWKIFRGTPPPLGWDPREWPATAPRTGAARSSRRCGSSRGGGSDGRGGVPARAPDGSRVARRAGAQPALA